MNSSSNRTPQTVTQTVDVRAPQRLPAPDIDGMGLMGLGRKLWRRKWLVVLCTVIGACSAVALTRLQQPVYRASARMEVAVPNSNFLNVGEVNPAMTAVSEDSHLQTQIEVLRTRTLVSRALAGMARDGNTAPPSASDISTAQRNLRVELLRGTRILSASFDSPDPLFAATFLNFLLQQYVQQGMETRWDSAQNVSNLLSSQLEALKGKVERSDDALQNYARASGLMFLSENENVAEQKLKHLEEELSKAQADTIQKRSRSEQVASASPETLAEVLENPSLRTYRSELVKLKQELADTSSLLTPSHYSVKRLEARIQELERLLNQEKQNILARVKNDFTSAFRREQLLREEYDRQAALVSGLAGKLARYNTLKQEAESSRQSYHSILQHVKEAGVASAIRASNVRVLDAAEAPTTAFSPRKELNLAAGILSGALLSIILVTLLPAASTSFVHPGESQQVLPVPELGAIPSGKARHLSLPGHLSQAIPRSADNKPLNLSGPQRYPRDVKKHNKMQLATLLSENSFFSESVRKVLASLLLNVGERPELRLLVFSSAQPGDGKTTVLSNLGIALARFGRRVLLVDADARKPSLHKIFHTVMKPGLVDVLKAADGNPELLESAIQPTNIPGLSILPSGTYEGNFTDLLFSANLESVVDKLRSEFDAVLIDTPPVLLLADARPLGRVADGVVLIVRSGETQRENALLAMQTFAEDGTQVIGTILNDWTPSDQRAYRSLAKYYRVQDTLRA